MPFLDRRRSNATALVAFHTALATDRAGRTIEDVWALGPDALEQAHDYIQWLFPLDEPSRAQPASPVLTPEAVEAIRRSPLATGRLLRSAQIMAAFYGFEVTRAGSEWRVTRAPSFEVRRRVWLTPGNHNYLRQTRILRSLLLLGQTELARSWLACLLDVYDEYGSVIGETTVAYWKAAIDLTSRQSPTK